MKRYFLKLSGLTAALMLFAVTVSAGDVKMRDDGIHYQPWIKVSFLDLKEDTEEAKAKGKGLGIIFEQPGCGSCKKLHEVNFAKPKLVKYITDNFDVLQINLYGDNEVTDFNGKVVSESKFAESMRVNFTPTTLFLDANGKELFRMPGFFREKFYKNGYEYVVDKGPQQGLSYPRWTRAKRERQAQQRTGL